MRFLCYLFIFCCALLASAAWAQSVHWEPSTGTLAFNQTSELQLVFDDCEPSDDPAVPAIPGLELQAVGRASNMSITNGQVAQSVIITFHARATQRTSLTIVPFSVNTNKGKVQVAAATYQVGDATVGQGNVSLDAVANSRFEAPSGVWAGQVFDLAYTLDVARRYFHSPGSNQPDWNPLPLTAEEWGKAEVARTLNAGEERLLITYRTRAMAKQPGEITLNSATQLVNLTTGTSSFGFFSQPNLEQYSITSARPTLTVRPLPGGAPAGFAGAVGQFALDSKVIPTSGAVGEPITWTLTLKGTGNWPDITGLPSRDVSRDFHVVQPQARRTMKQGSLFDGTIAEDVVLIPTQPGRYTLGPVVWSYFDPAKGSYQTITTGKVVVAVSAAPLQPTAPPAFGANAAAGSGAAAAATFSDHSPVTPPSAPAAIPRDPLTGSALAALPWSATSFAWALLSPLPALVIFWLSLAWRRASLTDPHRPLREAAARLRATLDQLSNAKKPEALHRLLQSWQRDTAVLWRFAPVVPRPQDFISSAPADMAQGQIWAALWAETEQVLYRPNAALSTDWEKRARSALEIKTVPSFSVLQLFALKNLLPFAAALLFTVFLLPQLGAQEIDPVKSYGSGDFATAEKSWQTRVDQQSNDWIARYDLSLSLAQQNRWGEASAQATAAFIQHPNNEAVRWNLAYAEERADFAPGSLTGFITEAPTYALARLFSPALWQRLMVAAAFVAAAGLGLILLRFYAPLGPWSSLTGLISIGLAAIGLLLGALALNRYQESGDKRAVLVWKPSLLRSIPTEVDATQKTAALAPGTLAISDKTFLDWTRLSFANGQTGWVRQDDVVRLWK